MRENSYVLRGALAFLLVILVGSASADEGRIPLWEPTVLDSTIPGVDISGKYVVTQNITSGGGGPVLTIICDGNDEVDIDLNGFTLFGNPGGGIDIILAQSCRSLAIRNGSLRALGPPPGDSVHIEATAQVIVEDLRITDGGNGIFLNESPNFNIRRNTIVNPDPDGIYIDGGGITVAITGTVADNLVRDSIGGGITVVNNHSSVAVLNNRIDTTFNASGIYMSGGAGCLVKENTVESANKDGIFMESIRRCKLHNNVVTSNGANGFFLIDFEDSLVLDNVSGGNGFSGIEHQGARVHFDRNVLNLNTCFGLHFLGPENTYGRNTARANSGAAVCGAALCGGGPIEICPAPYGGGAFPPDLCVDGPGNTSFCDNLMPGPPRS